jgi:hypothetical protein
MTEEAKLKRLASIALANVWFENSANRFSRSSSVDPWQCYDNFRINNVAKREIILDEVNRVNGEDKETSHKLKIEYLAENRFNVLIDKDKNGLKGSTVILHNAEVVENPEKPGELLIRTNEEQFPLPYLIDS